MVLLTRSSGLAMHPAKTRTSIVDLPEAGGSSSISSNNSCGKAVFTATSPPPQNHYLHSEDSGRYAPLGYKVLLASEYFCSPTHSEDVPAFAKAVSQGRHHHRPVHRYQNRNRSSLTLGSTNDIDGVREDLTSSSSTSLMTANDLAAAPCKRMSYTSLTNLDEWSPTTVSASSFLRHRDAAAGSKQAGGNGPVIRSNGNSSSNPSSRSSSYTSCTGSNGSFLGLNGHTSANGPKEKSEEGIYFNMNSTCGQKGLNISGDRLNVSGDRLNASGDSLSASGDRLTRSYPLAGQPRRAISDQSNTRTNLSQQREEQFATLTRALRRSVSADPNQREREEVVSGGPMRGRSPRTGSKDFPPPPAHQAEVVRNAAMPRVSSDGDLLESEYVTLNSVYPALQQQRVQRQDSQGSSTDSVLRKSSDVSSTASGGSTCYPQSSSPSSTFSSSSSTVTGGNFRRPGGGDEGSYVYGDNSSGGSSGYGSNGSIVGWTVPNRNPQDPLSPSTDFLAGSGAVSVTLQQRFASIDRLWIPPQGHHHHHQQQQHLHQQYYSHTSNHTQANGATPTTAPPFDLTRTWLAPRKKSGQTLQTVAEVLPSKSILKKSASHGQTSTRTTGCGSTRVYRDPPALATPICHVVRNDLRNGSSSSNLLVSRVLPPQTVYGTLARHSKRFNTFEDMDSSARGPLRGGTLASAERTGANGADSLPLYRLRLRSKSLSDLRPDPDLTSTTVTVTSGCYSDDEDGDDFGFLPLPAGAVSFVSRSPTAMQKAKGPEPGGGGGSTSPSHRLLPRRWRNKNKSASNAASPMAQPMWSPEGPCTWCNVSGRRVVLKPGSILHLSEAERLALQKLSVSRLQAMDLACPIVVPKDAGDQRRNKKRALSIKRRSKSANLASLLDTLTPSDKSKDKENKDVKQGLVFGIPLTRCLANDRELARQRAFAQNPALQTRGDTGDHLLAPRANRKSSSSSQGSLDNVAQNGSAVTGSAGHDSNRRAASSDSLSESDQSSRNTSSSFMEAVTSPNAQGGCREGLQMVGSTLQVPQVVDACFKHLETHGIHVLGIFRVGSSKKRVKQLREEFDSGKEVQLTEEHNPHDVGALLKEFFRDLPEPILTRDLYLPFVATRKIQGRQQQTEAMRLLLTLLPPANRDTLWALLRFLATVHRHSEDSTDRSGTEIPGNKMDSHNLAVLFGPNILHRSRAMTEKQFMAECAEQAELSSEVISVVKDMIDNHYELFEISANQHDEVLKLMMEADQENLDKVLRRLSNENKIEPDPESTCSVFEENDHSGAQSLPHSASSDADLLSLAKRKTGVVHHRPLRMSRSADPWTDPPQRSSSVGPGSNPFTEGRRVCSLEERLSPEASMQDSLPQATFSSQRTGTPGRPPLVTISHDCSDGVVLRNNGQRRGEDSTLAGAGILSTTRPLSSGPLPVTFGLASNSGSWDRPNTEVCKMLPAPHPAYMRENSGASSVSSNYLSLGGGPNGCDASPENSGPWGALVGKGSSSTLPVSTSGGSSPQPHKFVAKAASLPRSRLTNAVSSSSPGRPGHRTSSSRSDDDDGSGPAVGSPEWQRERWRHWEQITAGRNHGAADDSEQETLV